jgi:RND family efflux transporter MFP subunit
MGVTLQLARAETDVAKAEAAWIQAKSDMDRTSRLAKKDAVSRSELEASVARAKSAKSELDAAKIARDQAARKRALQTVTSPGDGDVLVLYQDAGNFVAAGTPIALIGDFSVMSMRVSLPDEKVRNLLSSGTPSFQESYAFHVNIGGGAGGKAFDNDFNGGYSLDASFDARVENVSPPLGESAAARNVTWVIANSSNILEEGLFTGAIIRSRQSRRVLSVPKDALRNMNTGVYVADAGSRLAWRDVRTGVYDAGFIEITEGFKEGDMVVISGVGGLKPGQRIDLREEETP